MDCSDWPPPLPSLPIPPPCLPSITAEPEEEAIILNSTASEWWDEYLDDALKQATGQQPTKKSPFLDLTSKQRREMLTIKMPTKQDKLVWDIPLPEGSYPPNGLPVWEKLYLDRKLPMLKCPPNSSVFARQKIGRKLWKNTEGQEFILYDPHAYEVPFPYENIHDSNLAEYYKGKAIRGFLLSLGDANEEGWGLCSLKRFNDFRKYLKRVHMSSVHAAMERQESLQDEFHLLSTYKQATNDTMDAIEKKCTQEEAGAALRGALLETRMNRKNKIIEALKEKEERINALNARRAAEREMKKQVGLKLQAEQELKRKIAAEIARRKRIATLRRWHENEDKRMKWIRKVEDEKAREKAEKVRLRWQNKIDNMKTMLKKEDEYVRLQTEIKERNIETRNRYVHTLKQREKDRLQELKTRNLAKKAMARREVEDKKLEAAITKVWLNTINTEYDLGTEVYRIKKSINSTMAELLTLPMEGPEPFSVIVMARNRIQREQIVPLQVSYALDVIIETAIEGWAKIRLNCILDIVTREAIKHGQKTLKDIKARCKDIGVYERELWKSTQPLGTIYKFDETKEGRKMTSASKPDSEAQLVGQLTSENLDKNVEANQLMATEPEIPKDTMMITYVHIGTFQLYDSPYDPLPPENLKPVSGRPKTPMPSQEILAQAGFEEEELEEVLPTIVGDDSGLKEKHKFRKAFRNVALQLLNRSKVTADRAYEPRSRYRSINKLVFLGDTDRNNVTSTLCTLIMNKSEKLMYECEEFEWVAQVVAREAVKEVLKPPEFQSVQNDGVPRTKIMFYKPKKRKAH